MKCLFIDTSHNLLSIAVTDNDKVLSKAVYKATNEHSKYAMMGIKKIFKKSGLEPNDIDKILVINGPGSFTGIRIGVTIAKIYAWALNKKVIPISTLKAYALSYTNYDYYVSVLNARRGFVYAGIYDKDYNNVIEEEYINIKELNKLIDNLKGSIVIMGDIDINKKIKTKMIKLDIPRVIRYYIDKLSINAHSLNPNYLKKVEAEEKLGNI